MDIVDGVNEAYDHELDQTEEYDLSPQTYHRLLAADVSINVGNIIWTGKVTGYKRDASGNLIGQTDPNPLLNTRMYQVQFSDGTIQDYSANYIAEAISLELRLMNNVDRDAAEAGDAWNKGLRNVVEMSFNNIIR